MLVVSATSEIAPLCRTGGLGDVAGALPAALRDQGVEVVSFCPFHEQVRRTAALRRLSVTDTGVEVRVPLAGRLVPTRIVEIEGPVRTFCVDARPLYDRESLYGFDDDGWRYALFSRAVLLAAPRLLGRAPDVFHVHDWQTGLLPLYLRQHPELAGSRAVFSIHNLAYQGVFPKELLPQVDVGWEHFTFDRLEFHDQVSFMKAGIAYADAVTTVSPTYAREILTPEFGQLLDPHLRAHSDRLHGILNGLDLEDWNPATDPALVEHFDVERPTGKAACRHDLLERFGLEASDDQPVLAVLSRFTGQKGLDLVCEVADHLVAQGARLVVLGTGDHALQDWFRWLQDAHPEAISVRVDFDDRLARKIVAGADALLIPSRFEPCGLTQMQAMRYGTVPIVHAVGGLRDTVHDPGDEALGRGEGDGFRFEHPTAAGLGWAAVRAIDMFRSHPERWANLSRACMERDWSWAPSARRYKALYEGLA